MKKIIIFLMLSVWSFSSLRASQIDNWKPERNVVFLGASICDFGWYVP
ncbi:MAG: hypothetical protein PF904_06190 [Kiritimatiellae bacterium]|nr:hypothetical protein [Kiritimatiellia bacterium]